MNMKTTILERLRYSLSPKDSKSLEIKLATLKVRGEAREASKRLKNQKRK